MSTIKGNWALSIATPIGQQEATLLLVPEGDTLTGTATGSGTTAPLENGVIEGNTVKFLVRVKKPMPMKATYTLTIAGDTLAGEVKVGAFGKAKVTGVRR
jgi:hypothetical protein